MEGKQKICVVTGTRAEYGILHWLMKEIEAVEDIDLKIIVTGMHLSPEFGLTYKEIEKDGFDIDRKIEMSLNSENPADVANSMGLGLIGFGKALQELQPDLMLVLGDRFEIFSAVAAAQVTRIPVAHLHGGESTEGAFDDAFRHSITKMSHLHFTATEKYRDRVIQMGEHPDTVFNVGALGIENIAKWSLMSQLELEESINFKFGERNFLITFHPVTLEDSTAKQQFANLLAVLEDLKDTKFIFTKANADTDGKIINQLIDIFVEKNPNKAVAFVSLGQIRYLSAMHLVDGVIGNSSSGIIEAPSVGVGTLNIGDRQAGRIKAASVIDCEPTVDSIKNALLQLISSEQIKKARQKENPYFKKNTSGKIMEILRKRTGKIRIKKKFFNLR